MTTGGDILDRLRTEVEHQKARDGEEDADDRVYLAWAALEEIELLRATNAALKEHALALRASATASEKDAARYRWLRDDAGHEDLDLLICEGSESWDGLIDTALGLDAAMEKANG